MIFRTITKNMAFHLETEAASGFLQFEGNKVMECRRVSIAPVTIKTLIAVCIAILKTSSLVSLNSWMVWQGSSLREEACRHLGYRDSIGVDWE